MYLLDDDTRLRELAFFIIAVMVHAGLLSSGLPGTGRGMGPSRAIAVDFVAALPAAAPAPPAPAPAPTPAPAPAVKPAPAKPLPVLRRTVVRRSHPRRAARRAAARPDRAQLAALRAAAESRSRARAEALAAAARRQAQARAQAAERQARVLEARRAAQALAASEARERAEAARQKTLAAAAARAQLARRRAEVRAERQRRRIEVSRELAALRDPDEVLSDAPNDPAAAAAGDPDTLAGSGGRAGAALPAGPQDAAEGPSLEGEALYDVQRDGFDPSRGGGGGAGIAWSVEGPLGNRRIVRKVLPESPAWVSERGLDLAVQVRFQILPDGRVKPGAVIRRTSGFPEIDRRALEALRLWKFEILPGKAPGNDAWGSVTFRFLMG